MPHCFCSQPARIALLIFISVSCCAQRVQAADWFERHTEWYGFDRFHFTIAERPAWLVVPKEPAAGRPWIWRARFPNFHFEMDVRLLERGYHVAYVDVAGLFGSPRAMAVGDRLYEYLTEEHKLSARPVLEGVSRGGLFVYNWAARHPDNVACIYCDTPVLDFKSWPAGRGAGIGSAAAWKQCLAAYGLTEEDALNFSGNPLQHAEIIARHKVPLLHIVSENDSVVPPKENTYLMRDRLRKFGHDMAIISVPKGTEKSHGHHFTHPEPDQVVQFVLKNTAAE